MRAGFVFAAAACVFALTNCVLQAQEPPPPMNGWTQQLSSMDRGTISVLLIFGTGLVSALCWGIGWIISCSRTGGADIEAIRDEVSVLSSRVAALEQAVGSPIGQGSESAMSR